MFSLFGLSKQYSNIVFYNTIKWIWPAHTCWKSFCSEFRIVSRTSLAAACSPSWHSWVSADYTQRGTSSSLARNDAVIGISTNNTRIHHSHGNISQSSRVLAWRVHLETKDFDLNKNVWLFLLSLHERYFSFVVRPHSMLTASLAQRANHLYRSSLRASTQANHWM